MHTLIVGSKPISLYQELNSRPRTFREPHLTTPTAIADIFSSKIWTRASHFESVRKHGRYSAHMHRIKDGYLKMTLSLSNITVWGAANLSLFHYFMHVSVFLFPLFFSHFRRWRKCKFYLIHPHDYIDYLLRRRYRQCCVSTNSIRKEHMACQKWNVKLLRETCGFFSTLFLVC